MVQLERRGRLQHHPPLSVGQTGRLMDWRGWATNIRQMRLGPAGPVVTPLGGGISGQDRGQQSPLPPQDRNTQSPWAGMGRGAPTSSPTCTFTT